MNSSLLLFLKTDFCSDTLTGSHATLKNERQWRQQAVDRTEEGEGTEWIWHDGRSRPIPFLLAAVSVCDIQAFTENRFAKEGQTENQETDRGGHIRGIEHTACRSVRTKQTATQKLWACTDWNQKTRRRNIHGSCSSHSTHKHLCLHLLELVYTA